tara:strand:+ start:336 stop:515 length:180 start_codon:yes stop_codon:yes gene_type:complete
VVSSCTCRCAFKQHGKHFVACGCVDANLFALVDQHGGKGILEDWREAERLRLPLNLVAG